MDVWSGADGAVGMSVGELKSGVASGSPGTGEENPEGVEACSVPSRSGVGFEAGLKSPQPIIKTSVNIQKSLVLINIRFERSKIKD